VTAIIAALAKGEPMPVAVVADQQDLQSEVDAEETETCADCGGLPCRCGKQCHSCGKDPCQCDPRSKRKELMNVMGGERD
jgi:hypothetical protein